MGGYFLPVNTANGGICCTLNTRYDGMQLPEDILTLAHYPKTVVLIEHTV
jgi:G3E family GTPase